MGDFLKFEKMITPIFIQIIFWIGFIGSIVGGFVMIGAGVMASSSGFIQIIIGLLILLLGPIIIRFYSEMLIVIFKMQGALTDIRDTLAEQEAVEHDDREVS